jgi:pyruvate,water dikinase
MQMVRSDLASSGVMFTIDTESGHPDFVFITGAWGLGENVVQGAVDPDEFYVHKPTFRQGFRSVLRRTLGDKQIRMVYAPGRTREPVVNRPTPKADRARYCLSDADVLELADAAIKIEDHYSRIAGEFRPMDIEWAKDGPDGAAVHRAGAARDGGLAPLGHAAGGVRARRPGPGAGQRPRRGRAHRQRPVRLVTDGRHLAAFKPGEVLVADTTTPDWEPVMKTAAAIVTNRGGRTCHAAIVARELGIPGGGGRRTRHRQLATTARP